MTTIETYFDRIFCINLDRRPDRWAECQEEFKKHGLTTVERFPAVGGIMIPWPPGSDTMEEDRITGCRYSHVGILRKLIASDWQNVLILEDDFKILHDDFNQRFSDMVARVPDDWDMLYLGGHYAEPPQYRVNEHVIKHGRMYTTSSYGITKKFAERIVDDVQEGGPIDVLYSGWHQKPDCKSYIFQPRLMIQRPSWSDIDHRHADNNWPMLNTDHENMV